MPVDTHELELQRYWWLKRLAATAAVLFVLLILAWLLWYWHANRQMARLIADLKAAGLPVRAEDLNRPAIPEARNGVPLLKQAIAQLPAVDVPASSAMSWKDELPYPPAWHQMMDKAFPAYAATYPLARQARLRGDADWQFRFSSPLLPTWSPAVGGLGSLRQLANVLGDTALYHHFKGDDREALQTIADCQYLAKATGEGGFLVHTLVALGVDALATHRLQVIASDLHIPPGQSGEALRAQVRRMIGELADDAPIDKWCTTALTGESVLAIDMSKTRTDLFVLAPLDRLQTVAAVRSMEIAKAAVQKPTLPAANALMSSIATAEIPSIAMDDARYLPRFVVTSYRMRLGRQAAAVSLAIALYRSDHGHYPASLEELVPTYVAAIPVDPMSSGGKPFTYLLAAGGKRPVLISAGEDGILQTTDESYLPSSACYGWQSTRGNKCDDQYLDLSAWKDPTPPAPTPSAPPGLPADFTEPE